MGWAQNKVFLPNNYCMLLTPTFLPAPNSHGIQDPWVPSLPWGRLLLTRILTLQDYLLLSNLMPPRNTPPLYKQTISSMLGRGKQKTIAMNIPHPVYTIENRRLASPTPNESPTRSVRQCNKEKWFEGGGFAGEGRTIWRAALRGPHQLFSALALPWPLNPVNLQKIHENNTGFPVAKSWDRERNF